MVVAVIQVVFFSAMPGLFDGWALLVALGFMLGAFGQIPINDFMIGKTASGPYRARIYGVRYVVSFTVLAATPAVDRLRLPQLGIRYAVPHPCGDGPGHPCSRGDPSQEIADAGNRIGAQSRVQL